MKAIVEILNLVVNSLPVIGDFIVRLKNKRKNKKQNSETKNAA